MQRPSIRMSGAVVVMALLLAGVQPSRAQERGSAPTARAAAGESEKIKPVTLRVGVPNKASEREVVFPLVVETSGSASVGRIRAELELSAMEGWSFRGVELTRGLDLRSNVRKRNDGGKLVVEWDVSAEGKELPTGHVALIRVQADKPSDKSKGKGPGTASAPASDNPPTLVVRKMSWGLAEFERLPDNLPQLNTPDGINGNQIGNPTGNPDVSCFFFTH